MAKTKPKARGIRHGIYFEPELLEQLRTEAVQRHLSVNWCVNEACREWLATLDQLAVAPGDRVLVTNQADPKLNGICVVGKSGKIRKARR